MDTLKERLSNLQMFLQELTEGKISKEEIISQSNYHIATMDLLNDHFKENVKLLKKIRSDIKKLKKLHKTHNTIKEDLK
jgi:hypothetical protein